MAETYSADVRATLAKAKRESDEPWVQLEGYVQLVLDILKTHDRICAAGSVQSEINVVPDAMSKPMCSLVQYVIGWISEVIKTGRDDGVMEFPGTPDSQAALIFSAAQGAMQYGRAHEAKKARQVLRQIKETLKPRS